MCICVCVCMYICMCVHVFIWCSCVGQKTIEWVDSFLLPCASWGLGKAIRFGGKDLYQLNYLNCLVYGTCYNGMGIYNDANMKVIKATRNSEQICVWKRSACIGKRYALAHLCSEKWSQQFHNVTGGRHRKDVCSKRIICLLTVRRTITLEYHTI